MPSKAHVTIVGNVGRPSELKYTNAGQPVLSFSVATDRYAGKDAQGEPKPAIVSWWEVSLFGRLGEAIHERGGLVKGELVTVWGEPYLDKWTGQDGGERYTLKVVASDVFASRRTDASAASAPTEDYSTIPF